MSVEAGAPAAGGVPSSTTLAMHLRRVYLGRQSGVFEIRHGEGTASLFFRQGELYLDRDHEVAFQLAPVLASLGEGARPASNAELRQETETLAQRFARYRGQPMEMKSDQSMVVELTGPLPTVCFLQEVAVVGLEEDELISQLGGVEARLVSHNETPALTQLPGLDPDMAQAMVALERAVRLGDLLRGSREERLKALRGITRLWSVGLVVRADQNQGQQEVLTPKLLRTFSERIAQDLEREPVAIESEEHRRQVADLLGHLGEFDHYQLLGIEARADGSEILSAYNDLARRVHPGHAQRLGLEGKEEAITVLFERATEAYLTLSDPRRRASYNTVAGIQVGPSVDADQREKEKRELARQRYRRAVGCISEMDYSLAIDLLREAIRLDPQPEYYARMGVAQSKNPHWQEQALRSFQSAVKLDPDNVGVRVAYASVLEKMERKDEAREQYKAALERRPDHLESRDALARLGGGGVAPQGGDFRSLFRATRDED